MAKPRLAKKARIRSQHLFPQSHLHSCVARLVLKASRSRLSQYLTICGGVCIILAKTSPTKLTMARKTTSMQSRMRMFRSKRVNVMWPVVVVVSFDVEVLSPSNVIRT